MVEESRGGAGRTRRRSSVEARREALDVARELLLTRGPAGVTLNSIAAKLGRSHATLIHHFGCAEELQAALMSRMVEDLSRSLSSAMSALEPVSERARGVVDIVFDAFDQDGAALLAAWIMLSQRERYLDPVRVAVRALAKSVDAWLADGPPDRARHLPSALLFLTLCAFGDALIGNSLSRTLGRDRDAMRVLAAQLLPGFL